MDPPEGLAESATAGAADLDRVSTNPYSLHKAVHARRSEYARRHRIRVKVGSWNVAACPGTDKDLGRWFVDGEGLDPVAGDDKIGLYVLGLQEVNLLSAPGQYMTWIYAADTSVTTRWKAALEAALPDGYQLVAVEQLAGMLLLAYASPEVAPTISNVSTTSVGTGALGYLGNKGAVCTRIVLGEATQLVFVNCHLASGVEDAYVERRIYQAQQVMSQTRFEPITIAGVSEDEKSKMGEEDFAFWFGDLNSRLDRLPGDDIRRLLMLHTKGEYDISKRDLRREDSLNGEPVVIQRLSDSSDEATSSDDSLVEQLSLREPDKAAESTVADDDSLVLPDPDELPLDAKEDPASLQATLESFLPHDQLRRLIKERKAFHEGWREGPIAFLPTYKYDVGTVALFDSSEKRRPPSWCDRILFRTRKDVERYEKRAKEEEEARRKDEEMKARGMDDADDDDQVLFAYDPDHDGEDQPSSASLGYDEYDEGEDGRDEQAAAQGETDRIHLDLYTSHQRITSSDHKPVSSIFTLDYDAVVPELKAKVHTEVARELDRAENEGRPGVTVVVDHHGSQHTTKRGSPDPSGHVDFGELRFLEQETAFLTLANTGRVPATVSFVDKAAVEDSDSIAATVQWLTPSFVHSDPADDSSEAADLGKEVTLEPGDTVNALLEALIDDGTLEEVLVLRVTDGRDHFVPVRASWAPTCIGRSVEELIRVPDGGIRALAKSLSEKKGQAGAIPYDLPVHRAAPKELLQLTEALETLTQRALADAQMLDDCAIPSNPGWPFDALTTPSRTLTALTIAVITALDTDTPIHSVFPPETPSLARLEATAQTLLLFLRGLTDGVIPAALWYRIEQAAIPTPSSPPPSSSAAAAAAAAAIERDDQVRTTVLDTLQSYPNHNICFVFLMTALAHAVVELAPVAKAEWEACSCQDRTVVLEPVVLVPRGRQVCLEMADVVLGFGELPAVSETLLCLLCSAFCVVECVCQLLLQNLSLVFAVPCLGLLLVQQAVRGVKSGLDDGKAKHDFRLVVLGLVQQFLQLRRPSNLGIVILLQIVQSRAMLDGEFGLFLLGLVQQLLQLRQADIVGSAILFEILQGSAMLRGELGLAKLCMLHLLACSPQLVLRG
ncbi:DNase I-like protein [Trichocladium antarcticum]|uniref:DNase I-like protein n=1 Tax=Trichocladium antarcticum TaxID=1450529 RepID=A0AAN6USW0_9PEZI|nr:DNase I-like protein [Trichocladium antarcticum]